MRPNCLRTIAAFALFGSALSTASVSGGELDGRWRNGTWTDDNTGHQGPLRARFRERDDGNYRVVFTGKFAKVMPFRFATTLNVVCRDGDQVVMAGQSRVLGFGRFNYHAVADGHNFNAQYSSWRWRGQFDLSR